MEAAYQYSLETLCQHFDPVEARSLTHILFEDIFRWKTGHADREMTPAEKRKLDEGLQRLIQGEPVQYVTGLSYFYSVWLRVNPAVLIPRPETEELVEWILETLQSGDKKSTAMAILDIGTGSGCIPLALKKEAPQHKISAIDVSSSALQLAKENAKDLGLPIQFKQLDILDENQWEEMGKFDVIVSNPPYIPEVEKQLMSQNVLAHEPALALFVADDDPLIFYRRILKFAEGHLQNTGYLFFECNEFNATQVAQLCRDAGFLRVDLRRDLQGKERMVRAVKRGQGSGFRGQPGRQPLAPEA